MNKCSKAQAQPAQPARGHHTARASLAALGLQLIQRQLFAPVREQVVIAQKVVRYTPTQKLFDGLVAMLAGAHGLVEINTRLRADHALAR